MSHTFLKCFTSLTVSQWSVLSYRVYIFKVQLELFGGRAEKSRQVFAHNCDQITIYTIIVLLF